jgi:hypothetical protein
MIRVSIGFRVCSATLLRQAGRNLPSLKHGITTLTSGELSLIFSSPAFGQEVSFYIEA